MVNVAEFYLDTGNLLTSVIMELLQLTVVNTVHHAVFLIKIWLTYKRDDK